MKVILLKSKKLIYNFIIILFYTSVNEYVYKYNISKIKTKN